MILSALHDLYGRLRSDPGYRLAPPGESLQKITFRVVLRPEGSLFAIQDVRSHEGGRARPRVERVLGTSKSSGSGLNPCFLWDNTGYLLGFHPDPDDKTRVRVQRAFEAFRQYHLDHEEEIGDPAYSAVCRFLESWDPADARRWETLDDIASGFGVFQIQGDAGYVHEAPAVRAWWRRRGGSEDGPTGRCLVTGEIAPVATTHPKVKGVRDAQTSGASLVSFNETAYESYGKRQGWNAPISVDAAFRYTTALNALLDGPRRDKHVLHLGDATVVFWTDRPSVVEDVFTRYAAGADLGSSTEAQDESVRSKVASFVRALRDGREAYGELEADPDGAGFFLLGLSPNAARLSVRFFHRGSVAALLDSLRRHHQAIRIAPQPARGKRRADPEFPPLWLLLAQTARDAKDVPPVLAGPLLRAVLTGAPYPEGLYAAVLRRIRADRTIDYPRACIIKGHLVRNRRMEVPVTLDLHRSDPAYRLGRLFAALEMTQKDAGIGASTIRDRFYSAASATPGSVMPRLLRTYQHHLAKLEGGRKVNREKLVQEIVAPLGEFPSQLDLTAQGLFALGYYHQTRDFYKPKQGGASTQAEEAEV